MSLLAGRPLLPEPEVLDRLLRNGRLRRVPVISEPISPTTPFAPSGAEGPARTFSCGVAGLDAALGGGFARGAVHEVVAPPSAGGTSLVRATLVRATRRGELCALIELEGAFDVAGANRSGLDARRLLWVHPANLAQALRAAEILLQAQLALVALDLVRLDQKPDRRERTDDLAPWARLARACEKHKGALVVLGHRPLAGSFSSTTVELSPRQALWAGRPGSPGRLFCGREVRGEVVRARRRPPAGPVRVGLRYDEGAPWDDQRPDQRKA